MFLRLLHLGICVLLSVVLCSAQTLPVDIFNGTDHDRINEPVTIAWSMIGDKLTQTELPGTRLLDSLGRSLPFQVDDLDMDGTPDELSFIVSIPVRSEQTYRFAFGADSLPSSRGPLHTDAAIYKRLDGVTTALDDDDDPGSLRKDSQYPFDGVGWESDVIGYRLYLDERNALDIQAKRVLGLQWNYIGTSGIDYQLDAWWGMDVLHVGPSFGFGGIAVWDGTKAVKPQTVARRRTRVIARGPIRTIVRVDYTGWKVGDRTVDLSSMFIQSTGSRVMEHRVLLRDATQSGQIATGIVRHASGTTSVDPEHGTILSTGKQARDAGDLIMIMAFSPSTVVKTYQTEVDDAVVLRVPQNGSLSMFLSARWDGEPDGSIGPDRIQDDLQNVLLRVQQPLRTRIRAGW